MYPRSGFEMCDVAPVTNPRLESIDPVRWASFRGITVLFDNSAAGLPSTGIDFYDRLEAFTLHHASELDMVALARLPRSTYHVTLLDLVNDANIETSGAYCAELRPFLEALPAIQGGAEISTAAAAFLDLVTTDQLLANAWAPVTLAFDELAIWANAVLVARLRLEAAHDHVTPLRTDLNARILASFGIQASPAYRPHVTLGYFANVQGAERAQRNLAEWSLSARNLVGERKLHFRSASVYAFTTLVEFMPVVRT